MTQNTPIIPDKGTMDATQSETTQNTTMPPTSETQPSMQSRLIQHTKSLFNTIKSIGCLWKPIACVIFLGVAIYVIVAACHGPGKIIAEATTMLIENVVETAKDVSTCVKNVTKKEVAAWTIGTVKGYSTTYVEGIKKTGLLKVLTCYAGDFLDLPYDPELRKSVNYIYQWEGAGEYVLNLNEVKIDVIEKGKEIVWENGNKTKTIKESVTKKLLVRAKAPFLDPDTLRSSDISPRFTFSKCNASKYEIELKKMQVYIDMYVNAALKAQLGIPENLARAKGNAEMLLRALCAPTVKDPKNDITIQWIE